MLTSVLKYFSNVFLMCMWRKNTWILCVRAYCKMMLLYIGKMFILRERCRSFQVFYWSFFFCSSILNHGCAVEWNAYNNFYLSPSIHLDVYTIWTSNKKKIDNSFTYRYECTYVSSYHSSDESVSHNMSTDMVLCRYVLANELITYSTVWMLCHL